MVDKVITFQGQSNRNIRFRDGENDMIYEGNSGFFMRQDIGNTRHEFFVGNSKKISVTSDGLTFGSDTAAVNALDDYEEGTWTPGIEFTGGTSVSYSGSSRNGEYVKVGSLVYIRLFVYASSTGSNSGQIKITGLPFTPNSGGYGRHAVSVTGGTFNLGTGLAGLFGLIEESVAKIDIYAGSVNGANATINSSMWNGSGMYVAGTYHVLGY